MDIQSEDSLMTIGEKGIECCRISADGKLEYLDAEKTLKCFDDIFFREDNPDAWRMLQVCRVFVKRIQELEQIIDGRDS